MEEQTGTNKLWWAIPGSVILILALLAMLGGKPPQAPEAGTSYDAGGEGSRAAYLVLKGLGYDVTASKRIAQGHIRWVLFPRESPKDLPILDAWVRDGGVLLLADDKDTFAAQLQVPIQVQKNVGEMAGVTLRTGDETLRIGDETLRLDGGPTDVTPRGRTSETWPPESTQPLVSIVSHGRGEVWLVHRPEFLRNNLLRKGDNAVILCRLADAVAGRDRIYFDEYFHGMRDRPGPLELLLQPPLLWVTLQGLCLLGLILWRELPRFGVLRALPVQRRRSKEEYLDALANLLGQKQAYDEGFRIARTAFTRELEDDLGLPASLSPRELAAHARARQPGLDSERLARALGREHLPRASAAAFLQAMNELEDLRKEFLLVGAGESR